MTATPARSSSPSRPDSAPTDPAWLQGELRRRVESAAAQAGLSVTALLEQWVVKGLEEAERQQALAEAAGRCSLRTGTCTAGPVPLPVQQ